MQGPKAEMAGLCVRDGGLHGFERTNLADQNHVGSLPHRIDQTALESIRIETHFALSDNRRLVSVYELDGVLDCEDVSRLVRVSMVNHRRQGCRLARTGGS